MAIDTSSGSSYGPIPAFVFVFNLVVGVGGLTLPFAFYNTGLILGTVVIAFMGFLAYVTLTFVIEAQGAANALLLLQEEQKEADMQLARSRLPKLAQTNDVEETDSSSLSQALLHPGHTVTVGSSDESPFEIRRRTEMGFMAQLFLGKKGTLFFYFVMIVYLFGDLAIYAVAVPKTLAKFTGGFTMGSLTFSDDSVYYLYVIIFGLLVCPFCYFNIQGTKGFQILTMVTRNTAFFTMIILGFVYVGQGHGSSSSDIKYFDFSGISSLYGSAVYAFMCHHSLPSIVTPIKNKNSLRKLFAIDYISIALAYTMLCMSAVFAFGGAEAAKCASSPGDPCKIQELYTLNFSSYHVQALAAYLTLFPCFTLTTNYPLIAITLRNNLQTLFESGLLTSNKQETTEVNKEAEMSNGVQEPLIPRAQPFCTRSRILYSSITAIPPIGIACLTHSVDALVNFTGAFAGLFIQFVIPTCLVYYARKSQVGNMDHELESTETYITADETTNGETNRVSVSFTTPSERRNIHQSPFSHRGWIYAMAVFSVITFVYNVYNQIRKFAA